MSDSASSPPRGGKPRRGSSDSIPQSHHSTTTTTHHHHHRGVKATVSRYEGRKKRRSRPSSEPKKQIHHDSSTSKETLNNSQEVVESLGDAPPLANGQPGGLSSSKQRSFRDMYEGARKKFSSSMHHKEKPSADDSTHHKRNFKDAFDVAKKKLSGSRQREAKRPEGSSTVERSFKDTYDTAKKRFSRSRQHRRAEEYKVGHSALHGSLDMQKETVQKELAEIKELGVVRSSTDNSVILKNHIHSHVSRMSNHRLTIKSGVDRKKSSVLVTMDDTEGQEREIQRQQRKAVMEKFFQVPSHKQRMLERLSSKQAEESVCFEEPQTRLRRRRTALQKKMEIVSVVS